MTFEQFEKILYSICEKEEIAGAAAHGSDDFYVKLWRCYGNDKLCQVHQLYDEITKFVKLDLNEENLHLKSENAYLKGKIEAYEWFLRKQGFIKGDEK